MIYASYEEFEKAVGVALAEMHIDSLIEVNLEDETQFMLTEKGVDKAEVILKEIGTKNQLLIALYLTGLQEEVVYADS